MNDIDKLDGMVKIKGKCGYEFIGGCRELRKYKQALEEIKEIADRTDGNHPASCINLVSVIRRTINEVLNDRD